MESVSGVKCGIAQGGSCGVRTQGTTRVRAWDAPTRGTVTWSRHGTLLQSTVTGHCHRVLSQGTRHGTLQHGTVTGHCHRAPSQGTTRVRAREEPMVRWCRGMAHHCQA